MTSLRRPDPLRFDDWADCVRDFDGGPIDGSNAWQVVDFGPDRTSFETLLRIADKAADPSAQLADGHVHGDHYWIVDDADAHLGFLALRHSIDTDFLRTQGGHIGYSVRPSFRRQGHASRALALALGRAAELGLDRVLVTCDVDNVASARTIESCGGVLEDEQLGKRRYWIDLPR